MSLIQQKQIAGSNGTASPVPANVVFVSPNFNDTHPYYQTVAGATYAATTTYRNVTLIEVFPGDYTGNGRIVVRVPLYCHQGAIFETMVVAQPVDVRGFATLNGNASYGPTLELSASGDYTVEFDTLESSTPIGADSALSIDDGVNGKIVIRAHSINGSYVANHHSVASAGDMVEIHADYFMGLYQDKDSFTVVDCRQFDYALVTVGQAFIDFKRCIQQTESPVAVQVYGKGSLTLSGGTIINDNYDSPACWLTQADESESRLILEQVSIRSRADCVKIDVASGKALLITKNCTLCGKRSITGNNVNLCTAKHEGGNSCANVAPTGVGQPVQTMFINANVEV